MDSTFHNKWYRFLINKCNALNPSVVYNTVHGSHIALSDIFVEQHIVHDAVYGIGRSITTKTSNREDDEYPKNTIDDVLSSKDNNRHLIIGSLGSGKTSLLNYICTQIAQYHLFGKATNSLIVNAYKDKFVAFMSLKEINKNVDMGLFEDFDLTSWIINETKKVCNTLEAKNLEENYAEITAKGVLLLVDGLDEVSIDDRKRLLAILNIFSKNLDNVVIASIRKEVLIEDSWIDEISGYQQTTLAEFNRTQIHDYVFKWKKLVAQDNEIKQAEVESIINTIFDNSYLSELSANPLFLTLMMLIAEEEGAFPKSRTRVFEEAIMLIIGRWTKESFESSEEILRIREALELAAFNGMNNLISQSKRSGDISAFIFDAFAKIFPEKIVGEYIKAVSEKTGVIVQSGNSKYSFALYSFMEFLAGSYIAKKMDMASFIDDHKDRLVSWQEVIVFGITIIAMKQEGIALAILYKLVKTDFQTSNRILPEIVLIAGIITQELTNETRKSDVAIFTKRIKSWLHHYISDKRISYRLRFEIGNVLGKLGDERPGVGIKKVNGISYPDIIWIRIPGGLSEFGSPEGHINLVHIEDVSSYLICKYPITNMQFELFVAEGYNKREYWTSEGWAWVNGKDQEYFNDETPGRYSAERRKQYEKWLQSRSLEKRTEPFWWHDYPWNIGNRPVVGITWYEAVAYCNWLNVYYREMLRHVLCANEIPNAQICLPTLEEWEKASRGPKNTKYPWGNTLDYKKIRGNFDICDLNETSAVGIFSEGKSGYGLFDAAGNVYEWISTGVVQTGIEKWVRKPEDIEGKFERLVKGGSWNMEYERAKAAYDEWDYPLIFDQNTGFRPIIRLDVKQQ